MIDLPNTKRSWSRVDDGVGRRCREELRREMDAQAKIDGLARPGRFIRGRGGRLAFSCSHQHRKPEGDIFAS